MSIAMLTNILTMMLCLAVLVQSVRLIRSLRAVKNGDLAETVKALDKATGEARTVLSEMKRTLAESAGIVRNVEQARALHDELSVMVGIADGAAERIVETMNRARAAGPATKAAKPAARKPARDTKTEAPADEPGTPAARKPRAPRKAPAAKPEAKAEPALDLAQVLKMAASA